MSKNNRLPARGTIARLLGCLFVSSMAFAANAQISATADLLDYGSTAPTPGTNDVYQLVQSQDNDGLNYYFDNGNPPGQTFTTGTNSTGYVLSTLYVKTAGGQGGLPSGGQAYQLRIYSVSGGSATLMATYTSSSSTFTFANSDWLQWTNLELGLQKNSEYAYTLHRVSAGWEKMANNGNNPYDGGEICLIPPAGGTITFGSTHVSDAVFDVGLAIPLTPVANQPTYTPNASPVYGGSQLALAETANGPGPLYYEWLTDGGTGGSLNPVGGFSTGNTLAVDTSGFTVGNTYNYAVVVTNAYGSVTSSVVALTITNASLPMIGSFTATPDTTTNFVGLDETFAASVSGTYPIAYQWQFSTNADGSNASFIGGATNSTLMMTNLQLTDSGYYSLQASNSVSPYTTNSAWTQLTVLPITNEFITWSNPVVFKGLNADQILTNVAGNYLEAATFGSATGPYLVKAGGTTYNFKGDGSSASISGNSGTTTGAYLGGTETTGNTNLDMALDNRAYNSGSGIITITLHNLVIGERYSVQLFGVDSVNSGRMVSFQDPNNAADVSATYDEGNLEYVVGQFTANSTDVDIQQNLLLRINSSGVANIDALVVRALSYHPTNAPTILTSPSDTTAYVGRTVHFSGDADGVPVPTYQWQDGSGNNLVNGNKFSGVNTATLTISNVTLSDSGSQYMLMATNVGGENVSSAATLTVLDAPPLSGAYSTNILALHPVAYWPLNDNAVDPYNGGNGGTAVYDASGNMFDGTYGSQAYNGFDAIVGPQAADGYPQFVSGQGALSPYTNTADSWATLPALNLNTNTVTMCLWVYPDGSQPDATGLLFDRNSGSVGGMCYSTGQRLGYTWNNNDSGTWSYTGGPVIPTNIWSLVALVVTPTSASFYVINTNGISSTSRSYNHSNMPWTGNSANITLGSDTASVVRTFNGTLDEAAVFNYALTSSQLVGLTGLSLVNTNAATANFKAAVATSGSGSNSTMNFTWASDHKGWQLYTNAVGLTATNSWFPVPGSASVTNESLTIDPSQPNVFFQLRYP